MDPLSWAVLYGMPCRAIPASMKPLEWAAFTDIDAGTADGGNTYERFSALL